MRSVNAGPDNWSEGIGTDKGQSEEANSFTLEEYEQMVNEVQEIAKENEGLTEGHKRVHPTARDSDDEDRVELEKVSGQLFVSLKGQQFDL